MSATDREISEDTDSTRADADADTRWGLTEAGRRALEELREDDEPPCARAPLEEPRFSARRPRCRP